MASFLGGLGQGLGAVGAGVGRGELAGTQFEYKARQQRALEDYKNSLLALQGDKLKSSADIAAERINEQQRQMFGRKAMMLGRSLNDPAQSDNFNRQPGLRKQVEDEYNDAMAVATGQLDWRHVAPSKFVDPVTGEVRLPPGVEGPFTGPKPGPWAPGMASGAPWQPQPGQPFSENPYLSTKDRAGQQRVETGQAAQTATEAYQKGQLDIGRGHLAIAGTKANADLVEKQFRDTLDLTRLQLAQGNTTFQQQQQIWGRLLGYAAATAKAGGDPGKDLKPFLFAHGMMGLQVPNDAVIRDYLSRNGESEDIIQKVIQGNPLHGSGKKELTQPSGAQPAGMVMGSFQNTSGPPQLPPVGNRDFAAFGGPDMGAPTPAQLGAKPASGGPLGVAPINGPAPGGGRGDINATAAGMGVNTPATAPHLRSPYPQGTVEDEVFGALTGRNGAPIPAKTILQNFQGTPYFRKVADVINRTNSSQQEGLFAGMPVAGTNGAEWPNVPGFAAEQVQIPGAAVFAPPGTTPVVNQGGYGGTAAAPSVSMSPSSPTAAPSPPAGDGWPPIPRMGPGPVQGPNRPLPPSPTGAIDLGPWNTGPLRTTPGPLTGPAFDQSRNVPRLAEPGSGATASPNLTQGFVPNDQGEPSGLHLEVSGHPVNVPAPPVVRQSQPGMMESMDQAGQQELGQLQAMPWGGIVDKFLRAKGVLDPEQQRLYHEWVTQRLVPSLVNVPKLSHKAILTMIPSILQKYARPQ